MQKKIGAFEARRNFGKILQGVAANGDHVIVERHGEPIAVVVPMHLYKQWERRRDAFFARWQAISERANMSEGDAERLVAEAIREVRAQER